MDLRFACNCQDDPGRSSAYAQPQSWRRPPVSASYQMVLETQAAELRAEFASLQREVELLRNERDVARLLNEYVYVHDEAFSPVFRKSDELDQRFEAFFTEDGVCDA
jgi:hypothetical protein